MSDTNLPDESPEFKEKAETLTAEKIVAERRASEERARIEFKKSSFDLQFKKLLEQLLEIINEKYGTDVGVTERTAINKYLVIYNKTRPEEHYPYFENLYNRNRSQVLCTLTNDSWLRRGKQVIQFGDGLVLTDRMKEKRIPLSSVYNMACELRTSAENIFDGLDSKLTGNSTDLIRPSIIQLHLMRIFYHLIETEDKVEIGKILTTLETDLQCKTRTVGYEPWRIIPPKPTASSSSGGGLSKLFPLAISMMEKFGISAPEGMVGPSEEDITNVVTTVFENPGAQNLIQGLVGSLQGCTDLGSAIRSVVNTVGDENSIGIIQDSIKATADIAQQSITKI